MVVIGAGIGGPDRGGGKVNCPAGRPGTRWCSGGPRPGWACGTQLTTPGLGCPGSIWAPPSLSAPPRTRCLLAADPGCDTTPALHTTPWGQSLIRLAVRRGALHTGTRSRTSGCLGLVDIGRAQWQFERIAKGSASLNSGTPQAAKLTPSAWRLAEIHQGPRPLLSRGSDGDHVAGDLGPSPTRSRMLHAVRYVPTGAGPIPTSPVARSRTTSRAARTRWRPGPAAELGDRIRLERGGHPHPVVAGRGGGDVVERRCGGPAGDPRLNRTGPAPRHRHRPGVAVIEYQQLAPALAAGR